MSGAVRPTPSSRFPWVTFSIFIVLGFAVRSLAAAMFPTVERPDEIYQNLEPAYRVLTGTGIVTWEWDVGIRSWLLPFGLSGILRLPALLHMPDTAALPLVWASLAGLSCTLIASGIILGWRAYGYTGAVLCGIFTAFWPDLVYFAPKTLAEVQSGNVMVIAAVLASTGPVRSSWKRLFCIGFLLAAAFALRFQLSLSLLIIACWAVRSAPLRGSVILALSALGPLVLLGSVDWWMLGTPFQSIWKNIQVNMIQHKADDYGSSPFYQYLYDIVVRNGSASILIGLLFAYGFKHAKLLAIIAISVVAFHSSISHKEISFIYAALPCAMIVVGLGAARLVDDLTRRFAPTRYGWLPATAAAGLAAASIVTIYISERPFSPSADQTAMRRLFSSARMQPDMCGLGLVGDGYFPWYATGGYVNLRRDVPIYLTTSSADFNESRSGFNYMIAPRLLLINDPALNVLSCSLGYCLFHAKRECEPVKIHLINDELLKINH